MFDKDIDVVKRKKSWTGLRDLESSFYVENGVNGLNTSEGSYKISTWKEPKYFKTQIELRCVG